VKVIPVTGLSGSGKTTFIRALIPLLARFGPVGTVKHTGHHSMELPEGKDTTVMFGAGAVAVAGIDREKTLVTLKSTSFSGALDILSGQGAAFAIVEGYKTGPLPKIVIGDIAVENCILRNPAPEDVMKALDRFPEYFTIRGIERELREDSAVAGRATAIASATIALPQRTDEKDLPGITRDLPGITSMRAVIHRGSLYGRSDELLVAVAAETGEAAADALKAILSRTR
jgi:molybdopterin-guanine dinucleotide biosynthesis protein MobB